MAGLQVATSGAKKRHPYDGWHKINLAGEIDTTNNAVRYRAVLLWPKNNATMRHPTANEVPHEPE